MSLLVIASRMHGMIQTDARYTRLQTVWSLPDHSRQANRGHSPCCHRRPNGPGRLADKVVQPTTQSAEGCTYLLLPLNRLVPYFFAIFFKSLDEKSRNFGSGHFSTCPNFHYLDILFPLKYLRHFPLTRNVNFHAADFLGG